MPQQHLMLLMAICIFMFANLSLTPVAFAESTLENLPQILKKNKPAVVAIGTLHAIRQPPVELKGTGFVVADGRHIVTNSHVVPRRRDLNAKEEIVVLVGRGNRPDIRRATIIDRDDVHDLALLKIEGTALPRMKLGTGAMIEEGSYVGYTGFPIGAVLGMYPVTHRGIIAAVTPIIIPRRRAQYLDPGMILQPRFDVYQLDATAYPGNSGSAVYDLREGRVQAVINSVKIKGSKEKALTSPTGITYAIPVVYVHKLLAKNGLK